MIIYCRVYFINQKIKCIIAVQLDMNSIMSLHAIFFVLFFVSSKAGIRSLSGVNSFVSLKLMSSREALLTLVAAIRFLSSVNSFVLLQGTSFREALIT